MKNPTSTLSGLPKETGINLENALVPYIQEPEKDNNENPIPQDLDVLNLLCDVTDNKLVMAATQVENQISGETCKTTRSKAVMKKNSPKLPLDNCLSGWNF